MRTSLILACGFAFVCATPVYLAPAAADPAYKADKVADFFAKAKADKLGASRRVCIEGDPDCATKTAPKPFDLMVNFEFDSDRLTPSAVENLGQFAEALHDPRLKGQRFAIDGFTDATGAEVYNKTLSERRAEAVAKYLASRGVERGALVAKGYGPTKPRAPDPFDPVNRRVETHLEE